MIRDEDIRVGKKYFVFLSSSKALRKELITRIYPREPKVEEIDFLALCEVLKVYYQINPFNKNKRVMIACKVKILKILASSSLFLKVGDKAIMWVFWIKHGDRAFSVWSRSCVNPSFNPSFLKSLSKEYSSKESR